MSSKLEIPDVTAEQMERVREFLARDHLEGFDGNEGTVRGDCIEVAFRYDPESVLLVVEPARLPEHLSDGAGAEPYSALRSMLDIARNSKTLEDHCGVYDYVYLTIDNQSGGTLTYSSSNIQHGIVKVDEQRVDSGKSVRAVTGESRKGSIVGAESEVVYTFADGITTLTMSYGLFSSSDYYYTAGLSGGNAARFTCVNTDECWMDGYTYLKGKSTIAKA